MWVTLKLRGNMVDVMYCGTFPPGAIVSPLIADRLVQQGRCATVRDVHSENGWTVQVSHYAPLAGLDAETLEVLQDAELLDRIESRRGRPVSDAVPIADFIAELENES